MKELRNRLSDFEAIFQHSIQQTWEAKNLPVNLEVMAKEADAIGNALIEIGDFSYQQLTVFTGALTQKQQFDYSWINFEWANLAKSLMILWRDILFQQQKGQSFKFIENTTKDKKVAF